MAHEHGADAESLVPIDHHKGDLGLLRVYENEAAAAADLLLAAFVEHCDQRNMFDEIDVDKERLLGFREMTFYVEEAAIEGLAAGVVDGLEERVSIVRPQCA